MEVWYGRECGVGRKVCGVEGGMVWMEVWCG